MKVIVLIIYFALFVVIVKCDTRGNRVRRIVGGLPADVPPWDDPVVYTRFNGRTARIQGIIDFPHYVFRGIPFAVPPTGKDRFLRPEEKFLQGHVNATSFPPPCLQPVPGTNRVVGSEDCLYLNVFTPQLPTGTEGLPVVLWIHGGGFRYGSASQYGVKHLVGKRLVVVTIQYRLGSLGFLSSGTKELPGNAALWDMALATQWVRNYIGFFGGNPYRIIVMGHNTGASSALLIALSNIAKGAVSGIVAMSGTAVSHWAMDNVPKNTVKEIAEQNGCPTTSALTMVKCLQHLPAESIIKGDSQVEFVRLESRGFVSGMSGQLGTAPVTEGYYDGRSLPSLIEDDPLTDLYKQKNPKIPLLTGITKDETKKAVNGYFKDEILQSLRSIPNYLDKVLVKKLQGLIGLNKLDTVHGTQKTSNKYSSIFDINSFQNYIQTKGSNIPEELQTISEATGDVLFNVPAFLTADLWSKIGAPTYLYRFDHCGNRKKGRFLLKGLPIVGNSTQDNLNDTVGHGDELAYLFDVHDVEGKLIEDSRNITEEDEQVRDVFTQMIADFARNGKINLNNQPVLPFSSASNNYVQIKSNPTSANNFRFCEMALWCGLADRLKSSSCQFMKVITSQIKNAQASIVATANNTNKQFSQIGSSVQQQGQNLLNKNNLFGNVLGKSGPNTVPVETKQAKKPSLFGMIG